ncbi:multidrug resistance protein [Paraphaeosphaeria sporulosa]
MRFASLLPEIPSTTARAQLEKGQAYQRATANFVRKFEPDVPPKIIHSFTKTLKCVWIIFCALAGVGFAMAWFEQEHEMRKTLNTAYGLKTPKSAGQTPAGTAPGSPVLTPMAEKSFEDVEEGPEGPSVETVE